jgi:hypothetical protein
MILRFLRPSIFAVIFDRAPQAHRHHQDTPRRGVDTGVVDTSHERSGSARNVIFS